MTSNSPATNGKELAGAQSLQSGSTSIDWYAEGQSRTIDVGGFRLTVRFIGRKGRRGRIAIEAPAGAVFRAVDGGRNDQTLPSPA